MYLRVVRNLTQDLRDTEKTQAFMEAVELRQRSYQTHRANVLILDSYDLISDHLLFYSSRDDKLIGYQRSVSAKKCREHELDFPIENLLRGRPEYVEGYAAFKAEAVEPLHMGYLCFDPAYREELEKVKIIDLAIWILFLVSGIARDLIGFTASINNRYKQDPYVRKIGDWIPGVSDLVHPLIPEPHRIVLIPRVRDTYWAEQEAKYSLFYSSLEEVSTRRNLRGILKVA